jgi:translocation and assembly module TamA
LRSLNESWELVGQYNDNAYILPGATLSNKRRRGLLVDPTAGFSQIYRAEAGSADLGSDIDLLRLYSNFTLVNTPATRHRIVARAELGAVFLASEDRINLAPSLSFFAGGSQSIRGYGYQSLGNEVLLVQRDDSVKSLTVGGDRLLTASMEYQYYVNDTWRGAVFVDAGDAFDEGEFEVNVGAGFGVHYITAVGAIKIELANSVSEDDPSWRLHINIGAEF